MSARNIAWAAGSALALFTALDVLAGSLGLVAGVPVGAWALALSAVGTCALVGGLWRGAAPRERALGLALAAAVVVLSVAAATSVVDMSYDGNSYQKAAIGALSHGWNPVYESIDAYFARTDVPLSPTTHALWADHYPKATWVFGASLHALTGSVESGKAVNIVAAAALALLLWRYLAERHLAPGWAAAAAVLAAVNPVTLPQLLTNYVDGLLASLVLAVVLMLVARADGGFPEGRGAPADLVLAALVLTAANVKFTGLVYAGFFCGAFWVLELARAGRAGGRAALGRAFRQRTGYYLLVVAASVLLAGSNSYVRNALDHGSPFYPLMGPETVDIIEGYQPDSFADMNPYEQFALSVLSRTENLWKEPVDLKVPFTFEPAELAVSAVDTRRAGFGAFSSGVFIASGAVCLAGCAVLWRRGPGRGREWVPVAAAFLVPAVALVGLTDGCWWARYTPYVWAAPVVALVMLAHRPERAAGAHARAPHGGPGSRRARLALAAALAAVTAADVATFAPAVASSLTCDAEADALVGRLLARGGQVEVTLSDHALCGFLYNLDDAGVDYRYVAYIPDAEVADGLGFVGLRVAG